MTMYNFTVRAEDNAGAFSDSSFALNVRNTKITSHVIAAGTAGVYTTSNGGDWTQHTMPQGQEIQYGNGLWVSYGTGLTVAQAYWTSNDGYNWERQTTPATIYTGSSYPAGPLAYGNGKWMMLAGGNGSTQFNTNAYTSLDGKNWDLVGSTPNASMYGRLAYGGGRWMVTPYSNGTSSLLTSVNDGVSWSVVTFPSAATINDLIFVNNRWVAIDNTGVWTSIDGVTWTRTGLPSASGTFSAVNITYGNGRYFIASTAGSGSTVIGWYSDDSINWVLVNGPSSPSASAINSTGCAYASGKFVVTRSTNNPLWSHDAITWTAITTLPASTRYSVAGIKSI